MAGRGWRDGSAVLPKDSCLNHSTRMAANTHLNRLPEDPMPSAGLYGYQAIKWCIDIHASTRTHRHTQTKTSTSFKSKRKDRKECLEVSHGSSQL